MQGGLGRGVSGARAPVAAASLLLTAAILLATSASIGAAADGARAARGHAPKVTITHGPPSKTGKHKATFKFKSDKKKTKFKCKLDGGSYSKCSSPKTVKVRKGKHTFGVYGTSLGVPGPVASREWTVTGKAAAGRHHSPQNFVFADGPGAPLNGVILAADGPVECAPQNCLVNDDTIEAQGGVIGGGPYEDCPHTYHYHGFLFGQPDPGAGCGWGQVTELSVVAPGVVVQNASVAITLEEASLLSSKPRTARARLSIASERLAAAVQSPSIDMADAAALSQAAELDSEADRALARAADLRGKRRDRKMKRAAKRIADALALKRQVWDRLVYGA